MHSFIYQAKLLFRDRTMMFWTFLFPLILATFFNLAFSKLNSSEGFEPSKLAVVEVKENKEFKSLLNELSKETDDQLLDVQYVSLTQAQQLLSDEDIDGYLTIDNTLKISVKENGIAQTIIQSVIDSYQQTTHTMNSIAKENPQALVQIIQEDLNMNQDYFESRQMSSLDVTVIYFYTLIGMTCMYGGFWGLKVSTNIEANLSRQGTRIQVAPVSKVKMILTGNIAAFIMQYLAMLLLLGYLTLGLNIAFGDQIGYILLLMAVGSYVGITLGNLIGNLFKCSENTKISILTSASLFCSFLSGMMVIDLKYIIQENVPILGYINPVSVITDALYALYYYPTYERFLLNVSILAVMGVILTMISVLLSRRKKYDSL